jgi:hypothetical protein
MTGTGSSNDQSPEVDTSIDISVAGAEISVSGSGPAVRNLVALILAAAVMYCGTI